MKDYSMKTKLVLILSFLYASNVFSQSDIEKAAINIHKCAHKYVTSLDDGVSDAKTISSVIVPLCDVETKKLENAFLKSSKLEFSHLSDYRIKALAKKTASERTATIVTISILKKRASKRKNPNGKSIKNKNIRRYKDVTYEVKKFETHISRNAFIKGTGGALLVQCIDSSSKKVASGLMLFLISQSEDFKFNDSSTKIGMSVDGKDVVPSLYNSYFTDSLPVPTYLNSLPWHEFLDKKNISIQLGKMVSLMIDLFKKGNFANFNEVNGAAKIQIPLAGFTKAMKRMKAECKAFAL